MKWFSKYWILKHKYDDLERKYLELYNMIDTDFWEWILNV